MKRISIDQCFLSEMTKDNPKFRKLKNAVQKAVRNKKAVCPIHIEESIFESSFVKPELREKVFDLQNELSIGYAFHTFAQQVRYGTFALFMPEIVYPTLRKVSLHIKPGTDFAALAQSLKQRKDNYADSLAKMPYPPPSYRKGMKGEDVMNQISAERAASMYRLVVAIKESRNLNTGKNEWDICVEIASALLSMKIGLQDCETLIHKVLNHHWEGIPHLWAHTRIDAQLELGYIAGRQAVINDQLDVSRVAIALNDADVVLCDTAMSEIIKQSKVLEIFNEAKVYSMQQADEAAAFIEAL